MIYIYALMFVSLWTIGSILFRFRHQSRLTLWVSGFMWIGGCGSFAVTIMTWFIRYAEAGSFVHALLRNAAVGAITVYFCLLCYMYVITSMAAASLWHNAKAFRLAAALLLVPPIYWLWTDVRFGTPTVLNVSGLRVWAGVYVAAGSILFLAAWRRELNRFNRRNRLRVALFFITAMVWAYGTDHLATQQVVMTVDGFETVGSPYWKANYLIVLFIVASFVLYAVKYGFMGVKLKIDRQMHEYSMRTLTAGSQFLHHSIRSEIQKIVYLNERARSQVESQPDKAIWAIDQADRVMGGLLERVHRLKHKSDDAALQERRIRLSTFVESLVEPYRELAVSRGAQLTVDARTDGELLCDPEYLNEALGALLENALDAVRPGEGELRLVVNKGLIGVTFQVEDNGTGIEKVHRHRVFEPFYTTKAAPQYYGLGLSFAHHIVQKHGGSIRLRASAPGKGATFVCRLPGMRLKED